ncbi:MAG: sensor histidine kinase [Frankiales bacterium]|nr:MAG: sensor histidine kinase [Frankiales bacterium]
MDLPDRLRATAARLRTTPGDLLLALAVTAASIADIHAGTTADPLVARLLAVPLLLSLAWRRRHAEPVLLAVCLLNLYLGAHTAGEFPPQLVFLALLLAIYSAAAHTTGRAAVRAGAASLVLVMAAHYLTPDGDAGDFLPQLVWGAPWLAGRLVRRQTLAAAESATRAADLQRRREQDLREARVRERDRIARELHDVVAHAVSLMVVQAGAERLRLGATAPETTDVLASVEGTGRLALADLRTMLGVLRDGAADDELAPQPQLSDLPALVERVRAVGLPVELELSGSPVAPTLGLTVYRIVQEALTNVLKHAGPVPTTVRVRADGGVLRLDVTSPLPVQLPEQRPGGRGLLGMSERVALHGGSVMCGPEDGLWAVHAELPVPAS